jgi:hypothetical protein
MKTMNTLRLSACLIGLVFATSLRSEEAKPEAPKQEVKADAYKDPFLNLAYEKTKLYSGKMEGALAKAIDITEKEAPGLARDYIKWRICYHALNILSVVVPATIFGIAAFCMFKKSKRLELARVKAGYGNREGLPDGEFQFGWGVAYAIVALLFSIGTIVHAFGNDHVSGLIQAIVAPKIYMAEKVMHLLGK